MILHGENGGAAKAKLQLASATPFGDLPSSRYLLLVNSKSMPRPQLFVASK